MSLPHDHWGNCYDCVYEQTYGAFYHHFTSETVNVVGRILTSGTILDFGAGTGRLSIPLAEKGYRMIAVDQSVGMINAFRSKIVDQNYNIEIHPCSILDYQGENADLAMAVFTVLSYITSEAELSKNIENICKHIKSNGFFLFDLPNPVFFENHTLVNKEKDNFRRHVVLMNTEAENIYTYKESCQCLCHGQRCDYEDEFKIRYWEMDTLDQFLRGQGFKDTEKSFPQFGSTGSTYKLYKRQ